MAGSLFCGSCGSRIPADAGFCGACGAKQASPGGVARVAAPLYYATFGVRLVAAIIDWIVIWLIWIVMGIALGAAEPAVDLDYYYTRLLLLILPFGYHSVFTATRGRTIGKSALGLRVVSEDGTKPGLDQALIRETIGKLVSTVVFYIGFIWAAFSREGKTWHDVLAGTRVVYARR
ncbi:MAG: RDD family protein [Dehalococcoidia bacterium]|jgi:uncharacterized RDD family membrane protein YckC|nr:RDD family protein [Dehalococcoidia bacterium]